MKNVGLYPRIQVDANGAGVVAQAGGVPLVETIRVAGLDRALSAALSRWRKPITRHDPGKVITDLALTLALGGDCLADIALLRAEPGCVRCGRLGSDCVPHDRSAGHGRGSGIEGDRRSAGRSSGPGLGSGVWPASTHRTAASMRTHRWSSTPKPP